MIEVDMWRWGTQRYMTHINMYMVKKKALRTELTHTAGGM